MAGGTGGGAAGGAAGGAGGGTGGGGADVCTLSAQRKCDYFIRCRADPTDVLSNNRPNDVISATQRTACEAHETFNCRYGAAGLARGRLTIDQTAFQACLNAAYPTGTCLRDPNAALLRCGFKQYLGADAGFGELCTTDLECRNGFCNVPSNATCGSCVPFLDADAGIAACTRDSQCTPTRSYCLNDDANPIAVPQPCQPFKALAATCNLNLLGTFSCIGQNCAQYVQQEECGPGQVCAGPSNNYRCAAGKTEGQACTKGNYECQRSGRGRYELVCASVGPSTDLCMKWSNAADGGICNTGETWQGLTIRGPYCQEFEYCASNNRCTPRGGVNDSCQSNDQCAWGLRCFNNFCVSYSELGDPCSSNGTPECKSLLSCPTGVNMCAPTYSLAGGACYNGGTRTPQCVSSYCDATGGNQGTCQALKADGLGCGAPSECQSGACVSSVCAAACWR